MNCPPIIYTRHSPPKVKGVVLDPSCSGSGTVVSRMDHLLPTAATLGMEAGGGAGGGSREDDEPKRVEQLAKFQVGSADAADGCLIAITDPLHLQPKPTNTHHQKQIAYTTQESALRHALRFPALQRLAYSTCSIHARENEGVVAAVLEEAKAAGFDLVDPFPGSGWGRRGAAGSLPGGRERLVVRTDPYEDGTDGFFVAVFERREGGGGGGGGGEGEAAGAKQQVKKKKTVGEKTTAVAPKKKKTKKTEGGV